MYIVYFKIFIAFHVYKILFVTFTWYWFTAGHLSVRDVVGLTTIYFTSITQKGERPCRRECAADW